MGTGERFIAIADAIDEPRVFGFVSEERSAVHQSLYLRGRQLPVLGDATNDLSANRSQQRFGLLALRRRHRGFGEAVGGGLVLAAVFDVGGDPEPVERIAKERDFRSEERRVGRE